MMQGTYGNPVTVGGATAASAATSGEGETSLPPCHVTSPAAGWRHGRIACAPPTRAIDFTHSSAPGVVRRAIIAAVCFFLLVSLLFLLLIRIIPARDYEETERCVAVNTRRTAHPASHSVGGSGGRRSC